MPPPAPVTIHTPSCPVLAGGIAAPTVAVLARGLAWAEREGRTQGFSQLRLGCFTSISNDLVCAAASDRRDIEGCIRSMTGRMRQVDGLPWRCPVCHPPAASERPGRRRRDQRRGVACLASSRPGGGRLGPARVSG